MNHLFFHSYVEENMNLFSADPHNKTNWGNKNDIKTLLLRERSNAMILKHVITFIKIIVYYKLSSN